MSGVTGERRVERGNTDVPSVTVVSSTTRASFLAGSLGLGTIETSTRSRRCVACVPNPQLPNTYNQRHTSPRDVHVATRLGLAAEAHL